MARIRTIKPEFWHDEKLAPLDPLTRLVFLGLIGMADDAGRVVANLKVIDAFIFASTSDTAREALATLSRIGRVAVGTTSSGQVVLQIANWERHQKVDRPNAKTCLPPIITELNTAAHFTEIRDTLASPSRENRVSLATPSRHDLGPRTNDLGPTTDDRSAPRARRTTRRDTDPSTDAVPDTWLTPYLRVWTEHAGTASAGELARYLRPIHTEAGHERTLAALTAFLLAGKAGFGVAVFARSWREWDGAPTGASPVRLSEQERRSARAVAAFVAGEATA